jgi:hypothetical protein
VIDSCLAAHPVQGEATVTFDQPTILRLLTELDRRDPRRRVFWADVHRYRLNPP